MAIRGADGAHQTPATANLSPVRGKIPSPQRPQRRPGSPSRLSRGAQETAGVASPFRLDAVDRDGRRQHDPDEFLLQLANIGRSLGDVIAATREPERAQALRLGQTLVEEIVERFRLTAAGAPAAAQEGDA